MTEENKKNTDACEDINEQNTNEEITPEDIDAAEAAQDTAEDADTKEPEEGTGSRKEAVLQQKVSELEDKVMRQMAEFENFRRRTNKEKEQRFSMGEKNVLEKMLPIVDNFERGLAAASEAEKGSAFAEGMDMIYKQLIKQLEDLGVAPIEAVGKEFDPTLHNAVMQVDSAEYETGIIAQEFQKGYKYRDDVLRHSMVGVAK